MFIVKNFNKIYVDGIYVLKNIIFIFFIGMVGLFGLNGVGKFIFM